LNDPGPSEITPEHLFMSRRRFMAGAVALTGGLLASACGLDDPAPANSTSSPSAASTAAVPTPAARVLEESLTPYETVTSFNNFFEFSMGKAEVADLSRGFRTEPWTVEVGGLVNRPRTYGIEDLMKSFPQEERVYRLRCVEAWSMVIPWMGFSLAQLLREVEPLSAARYVRFETLFDPEQMPGQRTRGFRWPYVEGLRLDEAMHDLTLMATGLYGKPALPQNGAPIRLVVPWKYGFKSVKSVVRIDLVEEMPESFWMRSAPHEYGFYANVNPDVAHPRWSQAREQRIGETGRRDTLLFNGYGEQVAGMYAGMDLRQQY
jgi:methionine sulfoxide reductase catalytic subunit